MANHDDMMGGNETQRPETAPTMDADELLGETLDRRYQIQQKLGRGGFGAVYLALDNKLAPRKVVVKVMRLEEANNQWNRARFKQEVEALSRIDHPGIVRVFDCGETTSGRPYIVMQYIDGNNLRSLLTPEGMTFSSVATIIRQIGDALTAAHDVGILHRDLKPENIMVKRKNDEEQVTVIDFGVAKVKDSIAALTTAQGIAVGTFAYMSPEQLSNQPLSPQSDIYALGVIAYEMLTGKRPNSPNFAFDHSRREDWVRPIDMRPDLTEAANDIIVKALSLKPDARYQRARDFGDQLAGALLDQKPRDQQITRNSELETAHVLFMDIVGYSKLLIDEQAQQLQQLQEIVRATRECTRAHAAGELLRLPTGDGMALVFFRDPEAPLRCAVEISRTVNANSGIALRMGIHSGLVLRMADINTNKNVAGGGINIAQRVMDCGDRGHILLSKSVADDLGQLARWSPSLEDLGEAEVKHGVRLHLFNLHGEDFGNPARPTKLQINSKPPQDRKKSLTIAVAIILLGLIGVGLWYGWRTKSAPQPVTPSEDRAGITPGPERAFTYWLMVQKMLKEKRLGDPFPSAGDIIFGNQWKFQLNLQPKQAGSLYVLSVGHGEKNSEEYNILFPLPASGKLNPTVTANQTVQSEWLVFDQYTGVEKVWIIWSSNPQPDLDSIFARAAQAEYLGEITGAQEIAKVQHYLKLYDAAKLEVVSDKSTKMTSFKGHGEIIVGLLTLSHESY